MSLFFRYSGVNATNAAPYIAKCPYQLYTVNTVDAVVPKKRVYKIKISHIIKNQKRLVIQNFLTESCKAFRALFPRKFGESTPERGSPVSVSNHAMSDYKKSSTC